MAKLSNGMRFGEFSSQDVLQDTILLIEFLIKCLTKHKRYQVGLLLKDPNRYCLKFFLFSNCVRSKPARKYCLIVGFIHAGWQYRI